MSVALSPVTWPRAVTSLPRYCLWEQPDRSFSLAAIGEALRLTAGESERFESVQARLSALTYAGVFEDSAAVTVPLCWAGFAFDPDQVHGSEWQAFPDALAVIPRLTFMQKEGASYLRLSALVNADCSVDSVLTEIERDLRQVLAATPSPPAPSTATSDLEVVDADGLPAWRESVALLTGMIARAGVEKVVLARRVELRAANDIEVAVPLQRLRERYPGCTVFAVRDGDACFLGATPETLVRLQSGEVRADCLAGSARRSASPAEDDAIGKALLADDKERREHALVLRGLTAALDDVCESIQAPQSPVLRKMANVQHLHTPVRARAAGERHILELVERLHPTPATGGLPRQEALRLIQDNESFNRGWYAGPLGWIDASGGGEFAVALRSALVSGRRALLYAGCGIVRGSDAGREYEESRIKLEAMRWALSAQA